MKRLAQTLILGVVTGLAFFQPLLNVDTFFGESHEQSIVYAQSAWSSTTTYFLDDVVTHSGSTWVNYTNGNIGNEPGVSSQWTLVPPTTGGTGTTPAAGGATTPATGTTGGVTPDASTPPSSSDGMSELNNAESAYSKAFGEYFTCDPFNGKIQGCVVEILYYFVFVPLQMITYIAAKFLDFFIAYSINSESYRGIQFIEQGWTIVRDLTNIAFIFALLYIAFNYIIDKAAVAKKLLINVIIIGLAINFSLFVTRVIVDAGNVLAHVFYNQINVVAGTAIDPATSDFNEKPISAAIVSQSNPQQIILRIQSGNGLIAPAIMAIIAASAFSVMLISIFASMAFLFVGRTVSLMIQMIFAPLAFASKIIPGIPLEQFQLNRWFSETLRLSFLAPVFIFFLYLVVLFLDAAQRVAYPTNGDIITTIIQVLLPFALSYFILKKGVDITKKLAGEAAVMVSNALNKATSWATTAALGAATGGTAMALRGTVGQAGSALAAKTAGKTDIGSRLANRYANKAASSTFDFRASRLGKFTQEKTGIKLGSVPESAKGGWEGSQKRYIEKQKERADEFAKIRDNESWNVNVKKAEDRLQEVKNTKDKAYDDAVKALEDARKEFKKAKEDGRSKDELDEIKEKIAAEKDKIRATQKYIDVKDAQEKLKEVKKAKDKESDRRREAYISDIMPQSIAYNNPLATSNATITEAKRNIRGTKEDTFENLGDKLSDEQVKANAEKRKAQREKEKEKNKSKTDKDKGDYTGGSNNSAQNPPRQPNPAQQGAQDTNRPQGTEQRQNTGAGANQNPYSTVIGQQTPQNPRPVQQPTSQPVAPQNQNSQQGTTQQTGRNNSYNQSPNIPSGPGAGPAGNTSR